MGWLSAALGALDPILNFIGVKDTNKTNKQNVAATNEANIQQTQMANEANERMANNVNALNYQMFNEGNAFSALEAEKARQFNASEAAKSREYNGAVAQVARALAAGVSPMEYNATAVGPATSSAQGSPMSGMAATTGAPAQAAKLEPVHEENPLANTNLLGFSNLLETIRKNTADISDASRNTKVKERAQDTNEENTRIAQRVADIQADAQKSQEELNKSSKELNESQTALNMFNLEHYPERLASELHLNDAQANAVTQQAAAAFAAIKVQYADIAARVDMNSKNIDESHRQALWQYIQFCDKQKQDFEIALQQIGLKSKEIEQAWTMFKKQFDKIHRGPFNAIWDYSGLRGLLNGVFSIFR